MSESNSEFRLITLSSPFRGIGIAKHCSWPYLAVATLGITVGICWAISGGKWYEITERSGFMNQPGLLISQVSRLIKVNTDEKGQCFKFNSRGECERFDYVFSLGEQHNPTVDSDQKTANFVLKDGHSHVVGDADHPPEKLISLLQERRVLATGVSPRWLDSRPENFLAKLDPESAWLW